MKLYSSPTSPFVRKVAILIREKGALAAVTEEQVSALADPVGLHAANPLGKVPALVLDDGATLFDSRVICEYLDQMLPGPSFLPAAGPARWQALRLQAVGDGMADAAVSLTFEKNRPEGERSANWMGRWRRAIVRSLDLLEAEAASLAGAPTLGTIAVGSALAYLDFRHADLGWQNGRPKLTAAYRALAERPSFRDTIPG